MVNVQAIDCIGQASGLPNAATMPALQCAGVVKRFGEVVAVDGLNLSLEPGRILALLGAQRLRQDHRPSFDSRL